MKTDCSVALSSLCTRKPSASSVLSLPAASKDTWHRQTLLKKKGQHQIVRAAQITTNSLTSVTHSKTNKKKEHLPAVPTLAFSASTLQNYRPLDSIFFLDSRSLSLSLTIAKCRLRLVVPIPYFKENKHSAYGVFKESTIIFSQLDHSPLKKGAEQTQANLFLVCTSLFLGPELGFSRIVNTQQNTHTNSKRHSRNGLKFYITPKNRFQHTSISSFHLSSSCFPPLFSLSLSLSLSPLELHICAKIIAL